MVYLPCHYRSGPVEKDSAAQALVAVSACWPCGRLWPAEPPKHTGVSSFVSNKQEVESESDATR